MLTTNKSRLLSLLVFVMIFAMLICIMSVSVFADDHDHDHDGDGTPDHAADDHDDKKEKTLKEKIDAWFASDVGQIVGYCVAGAIFVAIVIVIYLWIPKSKDKKGKKPAKAKK